MGGLLIIVMTLEVRLADQPFVKSPSDIKITTYQEWLLAKADIPFLPGYKNLLLVAQKQLLELPLRFLAKKHKFLIFRIELAVRLDYYIRKH